MKDQKKDSQHFTRRQFIKSTAVGTAICFATPTFSIGLDGEKSRVMSVRHSGLIDSQEKINAKIARQSVDTALLMLTQKENIKDAWSQIFPDLKSNDTVGLKVNALSRKCPTHPEIAYGIAQSLIESLGIDPNQIIIWDRAISELKKAGYTINQSDNGIRCFGTIEKFSISRWLLNSKQKESSGIGYDKSLPIDVGQGQTSHLSKILTRMCTYLINVPVLKDHNVAGVTLSLKNHFGTIDNPRDCHSNFCDPFVAKLNAAPQIRDKTRLIICDAAFGVYDGGPTGAPQFKHNAILAATDTVALDFTGTQIINAQRKLNGLDMVTDMAIHIKTAEKMGLGTCTKNRINFEERILS